MHMTRNVVREHVFGEPALAGLRPVPLVFVSERGPPVEVNHELAALAAHVVDLDEVDRRVRAYSGFIVVKFEVLHGLPSKRDSETPAMRPAESSGLPCGMRVTFGLLLAVGIISWPSRSVAGAEVDRDVPRGMPRFES